MSEENRRKKVGKVSFEERDQIKALYNRKNALIELFKTLSEDKVTTGSNLYEKLIADMAETSSKFNGWWDRMGKKYGWESAEGSSWEIDFDSADIFLAEKT